MLGKRSRWRGRTFAAAVGVLVAALVAVGLPVAPAAALLGSVDPAVSQRMCTGDSFTQSWVGPFNSQTGPGPRVYSRIFVPAGSDVDFTVTGSREKGAVKFLFQLAELGDPTGYVKTATKSFGHTVNETQGVMYPVNGHFELENVPGASRTLQVVAQPYDSPSFQTGSFRIQIKVRPANGQFYTCAKLSEARVEALFGESVSGKVADPVNPATGNFFDRTVDLAAPGGAYGMEFARTYNSLDFDPLWDPTTFQTGVLGPGWSTPLDTSLRNRPSGGLVLRMPDGRRLVFPAGGGGWTVPSELAASLAVQTASTPAAERRVLTFAGGEVWTFDGYGRLLEMADGFGATVALTRDPATNVVETMTSTTPGGASYEVAFADPDDDGLIDSATGPDGATVDYGYGADGRLESATRPYRSGETPGAEMFSYTSTGQIELIETDVDLSEDPVERVANTFDEYGRVATQAVPGGGEVAFTYCLPGESGCGLTEAGHFVTRVVHTAPGAADQTVHFIHDSLGRLTGVRDPFGHLASRSWTSLNGVDGFETRGGAAYDPQLDSAGRVESVALPDPSTGAVSGDVEEVVYCDASAGDPRPLEVADAAGLVTRFEYGPSSDPDYPCVDGEAVPSRVLTAYGTSEEAATEVDSASGLPTEVTDADGVATTMVWDAADRALLRQTVDGATTHHGYDEAGRLEVTRTPEGLESWWVYDGAGRVSEEIGPVPVTRTCSPGCDFSGGPPSGPSVPVVETAYWSDGSVREVTDELGHVTSVEREYLGGGGWRDITTYPDDGDGTDPDVRIEVHDAAGDLVEEQVGDPDDSPGDELAVTTYTHDLLGRTATSTSPEGVETRYGYDEDGNTTEVTAGPDDGGGDPDPDEDDSDTTTTVYDRRGRVTSVTGPDTDLGTGGRQAHSTTTYEYDAAGRVTETVEGAAGDALRTWSRYDAAGRLQYTITDLDGDDDTPDLGGSPSIDTADLVVERTYTDAGRLESVIRPPTDVSSFDWFDSGTEADKLTTTYGYDGVGRQDEITAPGALTTTLAYDADGRLTSETTPGGHITFYGVLYHSGGRTDSVTTPSPTGTGTAVATTTYNLRGEVVAETDPHDPGDTAYPARRFEYQPDGALAWAQDPRADTGTAADYRVSYSYDGRGNRTARTYNTQASTGDPLVARTETWAYNLDDQPTGHTRPGMSATTFTYDSRGRLETTILPSGRVETLTWWSSGLEASSTWSQPGETVVVVEQAYDSRGRRTELTDPTGTSTRTYDRAGSTTAFTQPNPGGSPYEYLYSYDLEGRPRTLTYADGGRARFSHDDQGRLELVETETAPDTWTDTAEYSWDDDGDPTAAALGGTHGTRAWAYPANDAHQPESYAQDIDPDGTDNEADNGGGGTDADLTTTLEWGYDGQLAAETTAGEDTGYTYDPAGQLLEADSETGTDHTYTYGPTGERLTHTAGGTTAHTYNSSGQLTATDTTGTSADVAYTYDGDGRRTEADTGTGAEVTTYLYDPRGLLAETETDDGSPETTARAYDGDGHLTLTDPDTGPATEITWDPTTGVPEMLELYTSDDDWTRYTYGTDRTASQPYTDGDPDSDPIAYPYDHRGSAIADGATTTPPGPYDPYGTPDSTPSDLQPGYRGEHHTGDLIHLRNRDYDPTTGTFTTQDPLDGVDATPTTANPYHYTDNDPTNKIDPLGLRAGDGGPWLAFVGAPPDEAPLWIAAGAAAAAVCTAGPIGLAICATVAVAVVVAVVINIDHPVVTTPGPGHDPDPGQDPIPVPLPQPDGQGGGDCSDSFQQGSGNSTALGRNLRAAGLNQPPETAAHHIVAKGALRASASRAVLTRFCVHIDDAVNGVFLPSNRASSNPGGAAVHASLHTRDYYTRVANDVAVASSRLELVAILASIRRQLLAGRYP